MHNPQFSCNGWQLQQIFKRQQQKPNTNPPSSTKFSHMYLFKTVFQLLLWKQYLAVWRNILLGVVRFFVVEILVKEFFYFFIKINKKTKINIDKWKYYIKPKKCVKREKIRQLWKERFFKRRSWLFSRGGAPRSTPHLSSSWTLAKPQRRLSGFFFSYASSSTLYPCQ